MKIPEIYKQVAKFLDAHDLVEALSLNSEDKFSYKFLFAGGYCRLMFSYSTCDVMQQLSQSVRVASKIVDHILGNVGDQSDQVVNRLFSCYLNQDSVPKTAIISRYADMLILLAKARGPDLVKRIYDAIRKETNPSMEGWIFKMFFFSKLRAPQAAEETQIQNRPLRPARRSEFGAGRR